MLVYLIIDASCLHVTVDNIHWMSASLKNFPLYTSIIPWIQNLNQMFLFRSLAFCVQKKDITEDAVNWKLQTLVIYFIYNYPCSNNDG